MLLFSIMFFCYSNVDIIIMCYSYVIILHHVLLLLKCRYHHNMFFCYSNVNSIMCYSHVIILHSVLQLLKCRYHHNVLFVCYYSPSCSSVTQMSIASCVIHMLLFSILFFSYSNVDIIIMCYSYVIILHHVPLLLKCR